jgi:hypothetical protein
MNNVFLINFFLSSEIFVVAKKNEALFLIYYQESGVNKLQKAKTK